MRRNIDLGTTRWGTFCLLIKTPNYCAFASLHSSHSRTRGGRGGWVRMGRGGHCEKSLATFCLEAGISLCVFFFFCTIWPALRLSLWKDSFCFECPAVKEQHRAVLTALQGPFVPIKVKYAREMFWWSWNSSSWKLDHQSTTKKKFPCKSSDASVFCRRCSCTRGPGGSGVKIVESGPPALGRVCFLLFFYSHFLQEIWDVLNFWACSSLPAVTSCFHYP